MAKKKDEKVVELIPKAVEEPKDFREEMTPEEIAEFMRLEEEELNARMNKFLMNTPLPDTSSLTEGDEDEEIITLDFDKGIATEKIGEGVAVRNEDGTIEIIDGPVADKVKEIATGQVVETPVEPPKPDLQRKYQDMIIDRFVTKAIASLVEKLNDTAFKAEAVISEQKLGYGIGDKLAYDAYEMIRKQKFEVQAAIAGGKVHYDKVPEWAKGYIDEYIMNALNTMIDFVERD